MQLINVDSGDNPHKTAGSSSSPTPRCGAAIISSTVGFALILAVPLGLLSFGCGTERSASDKGAGSTGPSLTTEFATKRLGGDTKTLQITAPSIDPTCPPPPPPVGACRHLDGTCLGMSQDACVPPNVWSDVASDDPRYCLQPPPLGAC